ncbi:MAG: S41 family peptidase [Anaerolineae bacterium]|nr:S41 family peptidase [Anaerolineae bacterium]
MIESLRVLCITVLTAVIIGVTFLSGFATGALVMHAPPSAPSPEATPLPDEEAQFQIFWEAWRLIEENFDGPIPDVRTRTYGAINGMLQTLGDDHTVLLSPEYAAIFGEDLSGSFEGIGALVKMREDGKLMIVEPFKGQPAERAGVQAGDIVLAVDGVTLQGLNLYEAIALIRGPKGTVVSLTIEREGVEQPFDIQVERARIEIPVVETRMLEGGIAYISLFEFSEPAPARFREALQELLEQEPRGLILDLRGNPGGYLGAAVSIGSEFISDGLILRERAKGGREIEHPATGNGVALDIPLVVLVDGGTASASEIVAGALQDHGRAVLIGEQTFGKGTVQIGYDLSDGAELRITIAHWFTPNGRAIEKEGLTPDIVVEMTQEDKDAGRDPQLERAIEYLKSQTSLRVD